MSTTFTNIKTLVQVRAKEVKKVAGLAMNDLPVINNAYLTIDNGFITAYGKMDDLTLPKDSKVVDCTGRLILPTWCDSHTHIVFAGQREEEFADKIRGLSYEEIAAKGGGILNSVEKLRQMSEDELYEQSKGRLEEVMSLGTGAVEIKSGYGLSVDAELKMLRVIKRLKDNYPATIKATFLAAHAFPREYLDDKEGYVDLIINDMLPKVVQENLADFVDVFTEKGYFTIEQTDRILKAATTYGLVPKIHVNQFNSIGGVALGVKYKALSVDHLEEFTAQDLTDLQDSLTMPVALPSCSFFLGIPYTPVRQIIDAGLPLALASDYNPGSTPSGNMNFVTALASIKMKMTPEEAINAATLNAAYAMGVEAELGSITIGKKANLMITKPIPSYGFIPYAFGSPLINRVYIEGELLK